MNVTNTPFFNKTSAKFYSKHGHTIAKIFRQLTARSWTPKIWPTLYISIFITETLCKLLVYASVRHW